jgi:hypothetical protein
VAARPPTTTANRPTRVFGTWTGPGAAPVAADAEEFWPGATDPAIILATIDVDGTKPVGTRLLVADGAIVASELAEIATPEPDAMMIDVGMLVVAIPAAELGDPTAALDVATVPAAADGDVLTLVAAAGAAEDTGPALFAATGTLAALLGDAAEALAGAATEVLVIAPTLESPAETRPAADEAAGTAAGVPTTDDAKLDDPTKAVSVVVTSDVVSIKSPL